MMNQEKNQDFLEKFLEENNDDDAFVESNTAKKRRRKKTNTLDLNYLEEEVKNVWIYPLTSLSGKTITEGIQVANEKTNIMVTTPKKGQKVRVYVEEIENYDLNEFVDPTNPTEQLIKASKDLNVTTIDVKNVNFNLLYLLTFEPITEANFENLKKYLSKTITPDVDTEQCDITFTPLEEFSTLFKAKPVQVMLSEPINAKIKEIHVTSPVGTLIGNIKAIDDFGRQPDLLAKDSTEIFPKLVFPFQTQPHISTVEYWASKQIIPLQEIFDFLKSKNIKYNGEFSLKDFLKLGKEADYPPLFVDHAREISWDEVSKRDQGSWKQTGSSGWYWAPGTPTDHNETLKYSKGSKRLYTVSVAPDGKSSMSLYDTVQEINNVNVTPLNVSKTTDAFKTICTMLTESFWKDMEFKGATKFEINNGQKIVSIDDENIYELQEKYAGQDRYAVTTNVWISWKRQNPDLVNANSEMIKRIENAIAMLSSVIKSNYSINKGDNDDYKVLLPFYFEIQNKLDNPSRYVAYKDIIVKLKSNYGEFTESGFNFNYKNIAKSKIFELEYNHFAFPEMTKSPETAAIPSSMPLDQQLANGEYSKYLMLNFAKSATKKELYLKRYGSGNMKHDPIAESLDNEGEFELSLASNINELEISAFYGFGNWKIIFVTEKTDDQESKQFELRLNLFSRGENKTLINLVL